MKKTKRNHLVIFDGDRFCPGEIPLCDHIDQIKTQVLFYRGVRAEIAESLRGKRGARKQLLQDALGAADVVINSLALSHLALIHLSDVHEDAYYKPKPEE